MLDDAQFDRRHFARQVAMGAGCLGIGLAAAVPAVAEEDRPPKRPDEKKEAEPQEKVAQDEPPPEVILLKYLISAYPSEHFDDKAIQGVFKDIRGDLARGEMLAAFPLKNSDEPAFVFQAYRGAGGREEESVRD